MKTILNYYSSLIKFFARVITTTALLLSVILQTNAHGDVNILENLYSFEVEHGDQTIVIERVQDKDAIVEGDFARMARSCPSLCVQPMHAAPAVQTIGIRELVTFMQVELFFEDGLIIDARTPDWHKKGTIPGSINIPYTEINKKSGASEFHISDTLERLGAQSDGDKWDFTNAAELVLWCNGNWCGQSPTAIKGLLAIGYPAEKIRYFRGGLEDWVQYGMPVVKPAK